MLARYLALPVALGATDYLTRYHAYLALDDKPDVAINCLIVLQGIRTAYIPEFEGETIQSEQAIATVFPELLRHDRPQGIIYANRALTDAECMTGPTLGVILGYINPGDFRLSENRKLNVSFMFIADYTIYELYSYVASDEVGTHELAARIKDICTELGVVFNLKLQAMITPATALAIALDAEITVPVQNLLLTVFSHQHHHLVVILHELAYIDLFSPACRELYVHVVHYARATWGMAFMADKLMPLIDSDNEYCMTLLQQVEVPLGLLEKCRAYYM